MKVLITGANGMIGKALCPVVAESGYKVLRAVRIASAPEDIAMGDIGENPSYGLALEGGVDVVVHLAGQVPTGGEGADEQHSTLFHQINTLGTANFARQCASSGVKRFVFVSTIKVMGEGKSEPYRIEDLAMPEGAYAISKWEAERRLRQISQETGMEVVILRPPLTYGPGVKGNFLHLLKAVAQRWPLPLGSIQNSRSLIYLGNLVDLIRLCVSHPSAGDKTFLVSDGDDVASPELICRMAAALGRKPLLVPIPVSWMRLAGLLLGKQATVNRLLGSLVVDISPLREVLGWEPPYTMQAGLAATAQWYKRTKSSI